MKLTAALVLAVASLETGYAAQQTAPISVSIACPTPNTEIGAEIRVNVTVTNVSDSPVRLFKALGPEGQAEAANDIEVHSADGKVLPRIDGRIVPVYGEDHHLAKSWLSRKGFSVGSGKSYEDFLVLNKLFDLSKPGQYTVLVRHQLRVDTPRPDEVPVPSNQITITVTE